MPDAVVHDVPTYYANIVTSNLNADDLTMEFRRIDRPHNKFLDGESSGQPLTIIPPATLGEIMEQQPVARIVLTFSAAKSLKQYLDAALPRAEQARKTGTQIA